MTFTLENLTDDPIATRIVPLRSVTSALPPLALIPRPPRAQRPPRGRRHAGRTKEVECVSPRARVAGPRPSVSTVPSSPGDGISGMGSERRTAFTATRPAGVGETVAARTMPRLSRVQQQFAQLGKRGVQVTVRTGDRPPEPSAQSTADRVA